MVTDFALGKVAAPLICIRQAIGTRFGWVGVAVGLLASLTSYLGLGTVLAGRQAVDTKIEAIEIVAGHAGAIPLTLQVAMVAPAATNCTRMSQQLFYQDRVVKGKVKRFYFPIGSALNGIGFAGSVLDFVLVLPIPLSLDEGDYYFLSRSAYNCSWLAGFVTRRLASETQPILVHISTAAPGAVPLPNLTLLKGEDK